ncbi:MAG: protein kinase domain-containing protein [bacterium]
MSLKEQRIGRYKLIKHIASGGMADVYMAVMTGPYGFEKPVALKLIHRQLSEDQSFINMFIDEAKISARLIHPNIVQIIDFGETEKHLYIAMEYVNGVDLSVFINALIDHKIKPINEIAVYITTQLLKAIGYTSALKDADGHTANIVHRDITPHNVLISFDGDVKLTDFGIAKARGSITTTLAGTLKGKIRYMSPEQARGEILDYRSDLYSIALILYELLTHRQAFSGDTDMTLLKHVQACMIDCAPTTINPAIPEALEMIVMKALSALPENRFQTAEQFEQALCRSCPDHPYSKAQLSRLLKELFNEQINSNVFNTSPGTYNIKKHPVIEGSITANSVIKWVVVTTGIVMSCMFILYSSSLSLFNKQHHLPTAILTNDKPQPISHTDNLNKTITQDISKTQTKVLVNNPLSQVNEHIKNKHVVPYSTIEINAIPWAEVYISDNASKRYIGITPVKGYKLPPGRYVVTLKNKIYGEKMLKLDVPLKSHKTLILKYDPVQKKVITSIQ